MATNNMEEVEEEVKNNEQNTTNIEEYPPELLIKHPLQHKWTFWYYEPDKHKSWEENQKIISNFETIEDFWSLYNHIKLASELRVGCDYSMFQQGIRPMWEDAANKRGGRWLMILDKHKHKLDVDHYWLETLLCMIGEAFNEYSDDVCGAVINVRPKAYKLGFWTADSNKAKSIMEIGRKFKERLNIAQTNAMCYQAHADVMTKLGSNARIMYQI